jgi:hypothetical protein
VATIAITILPRSINALPPGQINSTASQRRESRATIGTSHSCFARQGQGMGRGRYCLAVVHRPAHKETRHETESRTRHDRKQTTKRNALLGEERKRARLAGNKAQEKVQQQGILVTSPCKRKVRKRTQIQDRHNNNNDQNQIQI